MNKFYDYFLESTERTPVMAAIKNEDWLNASLTSPAEIIYILYGNIVNLPDIVAQIKGAGKKAIIHADLIAGLANKEISIDFIKHYTDADGIVSTKPNLIRRGNDLGLFTIERFFMLDFLAYDNIKKHVIVDEPDVIEIMPAGLSKMIKLLIELIDKPLIASGLLLDSSDVIDALKAGAIAVSTTNQKLWDCN